jgi:hypothetical protein
MHGDKHTLDPQALEDPSGFAASTSMDETELLLSTLLSSSEEAEIFDKKDMTPKLSSGARVDTVDT